MDKETKILMWVVISLFGGTGLFFLIRFLYKKSQTKEVKVNGNTFVTPKNVVIQSVAAVDTPLATAAASANRIASAIGSSPVPAQGAVGGDCFWVTESQFDNAGNWTGNHQVKYCRNKGGSYSTI